MVSGTCGLSRAWTRKVYVSYQGWCAVSDLPVLRLVRDGLFEAPCNGVRIPAAFVAEYVGNLTCDTTWVFEVEGLANAVYCSHCWHALRPCPSCADWQCHCNLPQAPLLKPAERRLMPRQHYDRDFVPYRSDALLDNGDRRDENN